jgi:hypothetical protein
MIDLSEVASPMRDSSCKALCNFSIRSCFLLVIKDAICYLGDPNVHRTVVVSDVENVVFSRPGKGPKNAGTSGHFMYTCLELSDSQFC